MSLHKFRGICIALVGFVVSPANAEVLPQTAAEGARMEQADALPLTDFYTTPGDLAASKPGALLRKEVFTGYALPAGVSAVRILYHSLDSFGHDVASSAVVLTPKGNAPPGGWPVIAWAHGTSGVARMCAPSLMKDVYYGTDVLGPMVAAGYAVVATDYHGLGTEGPHQYVNKAAQSNDVIYSVPAARAAQPGLGRKWVVDGHSQGGMTAWGVAEIEHERRDPDFLGAVSVAGAVQKNAFFRELTRTPDLGFYLAFMAAGIHASFPTFAPRELLSDAALAHYDDVSTRGCWYYAYATYRSVPGNTLLRSGWEKNEAVEKFFDNAQVGAAPLGAPLFVIAGEADQTVPLKGVQGAVHNLCRAGQPVTFRSYPGLDHDPVMDNSLPDQLAWIRERFAGRPLKSNCGA